MNLRILKEEVTLYATYEDAVRAYDRESEFKHDMLGTRPVVEMHPTENFPLDTYKGIPFIAEGVLMTSDTGWKYWIQKFRYQKRNTVNGEDLPNLERRGIYYKPMSIRSADGVLVWLRSD